MQEHPAGTRHPAPRERPRRSVTHAADRNAARSEDLDGEVGIDVVVAHEADDPASRQLLDLAADVGAHDALPAPAQIEHGRALAGFCERLLAARQAVVEHDEHAVLAERGLGLGGAPTGGARERLDHRVRDRCGDFAVLLATLAAHIATLCLGGGIDPPTLPRRPHRRPDGPCKRSLPDSRFRGHSYIAAIGATVGIRWPPRPPTRTDGMRRNGVVSDQEGEPHGSSPRRRASAGGRTHARPPVSRAPRSPSIGEARRFVSDWLRSSLPGHDLIVGDVALAVSEACTSAVVHAYRADGRGDPDPSFRVVAGHDGTIVRVTISDHGSGMVPRPDSAGLGLGLRVIDAVTDAVEVGSSEDGRGTAVAMRFSAAGAETRVPFPDAASAVAATP